jgi:hypothetical protein
MLKSTNVASSAAKWSVVLVSGGLERGADRVVGHQQSVLKASIRPSTRGFVVNPPSPRVFRKHVGYLHSREGGPVNGGCSTSDVVSGDDAKQRVVRGGREQKTRRPCLDDSGRRGSWRARKRTGSRT